MKNKFETYLRNKLNVKADELLVVGVSGGMDSMLLVTLLKEVGQSFIIAHCNFKLRGEASDGDEKFVEAWAQNNGVEFRSISFDTDQYKKKMGVGTQEAARELRHNWFVKLKDDIGAKYIALAHHADDRIETILFNWTRGAGLKGLSAVRPTEGVIIRPLIDFTREEIEECAKLIKLQWREDKSNESTDYSRNYIRHEVLSKIAERFSGSKKNMALSIDFLDEARYFIEAELVRWKEEKLKQEQDVILIDTKAFNERDNYLLQIYLYDLGVSREEVKKLMNALNESGKLFSTRNFNIFCDRQTLTIKSIGIQDSNSWATKELLYDGVVRFGSKEIRVSIIESPNKSTVMSSGTRECFVDMSKINGELSVRTWRDGDKVKLLGMKGRTLLSDLFIDAKIPLHLKSDIALVVDDQNIVWVEGFRVAEDYKLDDKSQKVIKIQISDDGNTIM